MANGKGSLECVYCKHYSHWEIIKSKPKCKYHKVELPICISNRVCIDFEPTRHYWKHNSHNLTREINFTQFHEELKPGILYLFPYNAPDEIIDRIDLKGR